MARGAGAHFALSGRRRFTYFAGLMQRRSATVGAFSYHRRR